MNLNTVMKTLNSDESKILFLDHKKLQKVHACLLEMLQDIEQICQEYNISWSLSGGSVLGAVRERGFIPWDDDIDINMTRKDYEHFLMVFPGKYENKYWLLKPGDKNYLFHMPKIMLKRSKFREIQSIDEGYHGLNIDIFIMENTYDNWLLRNLHGLQCTFLLFVLSCLRVNLCEKTFLSVAGENMQLVQALKKRKCLSHLFSFYKLEKWLRISDNCFCRVKKHTSRFIVIPTGRNHYFGEVYKRAQLCQFQTVIFENMHVYIPVGYDYYLKKLYGLSYMTPPIEAKKEKHAIIEFDLEKYQQSQ